MYQECSRLRAAESETARRLAEAQRQLAQYRTAADEEEVARVWKLCESALRTLWKLREDMTAHVAMHDNDSMAAQGD